MVARHQWNALVCAQLAQQRDELLRIGELAAADVIIELCHQLRSFERLVLARERDVEDEHRLIRCVLVLVDQREGIAVARPVKLRRALARALLHVQAICAEMRVVFFGLITFIRIQKTQRVPQSLDARRGRLRQLQRVAQRVAVLALESNFAAPACIMLYEDAAYEKFRLREFERIGSRSSLVFRSYFRR